jgi:hypothetical protein
VIQDRQNHEATQEEWRELARQASGEEDPERVIELAQQVVEKFDEENRRKRLPPGSILLWPA